MASILDGLNPVQREIVKDTEGQVLVLAGAGSGKTRVLTHRIAYLLHQGIPPWQILAVTFTNKAAREMRERLVALSGTQARDIWIGTFHGICVRMLGRFGSEIGYDSFTIIDDSEQKKIIKETIATIGIDYDIDFIMGYISDAKNRLLTYQDLEAEAAQQHDKDVVNIYRAYEEKKDELGYFDFDDLIMKTVQLLENSKDARETYQGQFHYIHTDETQDTNRAQFRLLTELCEKHQNIFAVGDSDQSIYKWRGAEISNIINFNQYFPEVKVYRLEQNYRSTNTIVTASNSLILNNKERLDKTAFTEKAGGDPILIYEADDELVEAEFITDAIEGLHRVRHRPYSDLAVLYRTNRQSRAIELSLKKRNIPYQIVGGHAFYDRKEIKDTIAYLRAIANDIDALAFERIINVPKRGIGATTVTKINDYAHDCVVPFPKALDRIDDIPKITPRTKNKIKEFSALVNGFREYAASEDFSVAELIKKIVTETGYLEKLDPDKSEDAARLENIQELINDAGRWDQDEDNAQKTLNDFLNETSLVAGVDSLDEGSHVTLMTLHSSKGLEFPIVFIAGMEEGIFPHGKSMSDDAEMEEERRLAYVGMTRAEERLYLSHCQKRYQYGQSTPIFCKPSRFLKELPKELVKRV